jgi:hypothetical protein
MSTDEKVQDYIERAMKIAPKIGLPIVDPSFSAVETGLFLSGIMDIAKMIQLEELNKPFISGKLVVEEEA